MAVSRRAFIVGAGAAVGGSSVAPATAAAAARVGVAPEAREAVGVIGTILQDGLELTGFGWLTHVAGLTNADLFTDPSKRGAATARFLWHAEVRVGTLDLLPGLFYGTGNGRLRIFFASAAGANNDDPASFASGRMVARYTGVFRNIQTVIAPDHAVTEIIGELSQRETHRFTVRGHHHQLGRNGLLQRLQASGPAVRTEPTTPRSTRYVAGGISIPR
jgi:hypothetical protein